MTQSMTGDARGMSDGARRDRSAILAVGTAPALAELGDACDRPIVHAANLFDAVGELSVAGPRQPIDAVFVDVELAAAATERAIDALRRFDPAVRLVLVRTNREADLAERIQACFSSVLNLPLTAESVEAAVNGMGADSATGSEAARSIEIETYPQAKPSADRAEQKSPQAGREPHQAATGASPSRPDEEESVACEPLGDIDLVDAILRDEGGVADRAVTLLAQQTGWRGVELRREPTTRGIAVLYEDAFYGTLVADAPREEIEPWAQWLGHWLALDTSYRRFRTQSLTDDLTGAWNRRYFETFLDGCLARAAERRRPVSVMVLDIDDFKHYNDAFGHSAGDEILRETVRLLSSVIRKGDRVCRIGGDEFAVVFADLEGPREPGSEHPHSVEQITQRFQNEICQMRFPKLGIEAPATLSVSAGLATYPWDGHDAASLLEHADQLALESKRRGKNAITMGPGAQRVCGKH